MDDAKDDLNVKLGDLIGKSEESILQNWIERLKEELGGTELGNTELRDSVPDYLAGLSKVLLDGQSPRSGGREVLADVAQQHAVARVQQGFDITMLIKEFMLLRLTMVEIAREAGFSGEEVFEIITEFVEEAIRLSVASYVEYRDRESRSVEKEHVAFLTHELRNPLGTAVLGVSQLKALLPDGGSEARLVYLIERSQAKLRDLIEGVLAVTKAEAGEQAKLSEMELRDVLDEALVSANETAKSKGIEIKTNYDQTPRLKLDRRLMLSAIQNLLDNAVKFSPRGVIELWTRQDDSGVSIHVRDRCGGLSEDELCNMFTPFQRGEQRTEPGTGLGLSIARRAIEAHGGTLKAETADEGCHFWITLPQQAYA